MTCGWLNDILSWLSPFVLLWLRTVQRILLIPESDEMFSVLQAVEKFLSNHQPTIFNFIDI
jgi:hypothetical protein